MAAVGGSGQPVEVSGADRVRLCYHVLSLLNPADATAWNFPIGW